MAVFDVQLCVNTLLYFFIFVCGFAISIPIGVTDIQSKGCVLYGSLKPFNATHYTLSFSSKANCDFPIYVGVFVCIFYALGMGIYNSYAIYKSQKDPSISSQMWVMPFILLNSLVTAVMFVSSCIVSVGFRELCDSLTQDKPYQYYSRNTTQCYKSHRVHSVSYHYHHSVRSTYICDKAQNQKLRLDGTSNIVSLGHFYAYINVTQTASWICTLGWLALVISGIVRFALNRRLRTQGAAMSSDTANISTIEPTA